VYLAISIRDSLSCVPGKIVPRDFHNGQSHSRRLAETLSRLPLSLSLSRLGASAIRSAIESGDGINHV